MSNHIYVLCGISGSGKTTLANTLAIEYNAKLYSYDELLKGGEKSPKELRQWILLSIEKDLRDGLNVILDDSNILISLRQEVLDAIKDCGSKKVLIVMTTPLDVCLSRRQQSPRWVLEHMYRKFELPSCDEGWDEIISI